MDLLDHVVATYNVDRNRVYLTGLSMGGRACWRVVLAGPNRFAAIVAICGRYDADWANLHQLADIPTRIYHGAADSAVTESERILRGLAAINADVDLTVYPGVGHNAWDPAYHDPALLAWLLGQRRTATKSD